MAHFFTSDLHFGHANVIRYAGRPFASVEEMNDALVDRWNEVVTAQDEVYVVGDFALCRREDAVRHARRLNGQKFLVQGNHDKGMHRELEQCFGWVKDLYTVKVPDADAPDGVQRIVLCHYAMRVWDMSHYGAWQLYGHSHGSLPDDPFARSIDVGVDCWDYRPVSYEQVKARMALKQYRPVDHHADR